MQDKRAKQNYYQQQVVNGERELGGAGSDIWSSPRGGGGECGGKLRRTEFHQQRGITEFVTTAMRNHKAEGGITVESRSNEALVKFASETMGHAEKKIVRANTTGNRAGDHHRDEKTGKERARRRGRNPSN